ncbi:Putative UDP-glucuronate\\x3axylan alpha-glucuronosyltransferase 4 [Striga hermonthica]|uniref:Hexosyltransferase n=1 Tax=Striga hermonthica TaxID=68872 RepID=A0A9N7N408_STRHE|nr:Putative UDP-glucuronate\\x3axylan alpha-glucuronosyltransferase 4 [Striga hermonthica]
MAPKPSKPKPFTIPYTLFMIALTLFTFHYLRQIRDDFQVRATQGKLVTSIRPEWLNFAMREFGEERTINVGFVNTDEIRAEGVKTGTVDFDMVGADDIKWSELFPSWIDESSPSGCPRIPMPEFRDYRELDVVVARVPSEESGDLRSVFRLQVNLVVANLLVRSGRKDGPVFAVFIGSGGPMWEIFRCDDLLWNVGETWVYKPDLERIKQKVVMPVGSCQISPPFSQSGEEQLRSKNHYIRQPKEAYVTVLHSSESYVCGAIALAQSIIQTNSTKDLVLLADEHITPHSIQGLRSAGWKIKRIKRIRSPHSKKYAYNEWNYSKLRIWQLKGYDKVMFIDSDFIVTKNIDKFFVYPQISASGNDGHIFNSGLMVVEPSACTFETLMRKRFTVESYNGGDQGFLNEMFPWWHRLPAKLNWLKFFGSGREYAQRIPDDTHAIHYLGLKPWWCYRDYDCNWDKIEAQQFASDSANEKWWDVYDNMPKELREYCSLTPEMDGNIRRYRERARNASLPDGHWKIEIKDERRNFM